MKGLLLSDWMTISHPHHQNRLEDKAARLPKFYQAITKTHEAMSSKIVDEEKSILAENINELCRALI